MSEKEPLVDLVLSAVNVLEVMENGTDAEIAEARMLLFVKATATKRMLAARGPKRGKVTE